MSGIDEEQETLGLEAAWLSEDVAKAIRRAENEKRVYSFFGKNKRIDATIAPFIEVREDFHDLEP